MLVRARATLAGLGGWRRWAAAAGLGAVTALALPPLYAAPLLLLTIPGLLILIGSARGWRGALAAGFWFGFGLHVVGLYWITEAIMLEAARFWWLEPIAVPGVSAALAVFVAVPCALAWRARPGAARVMALAGAWVLGDLARQFVLTGFPWNPLGSAWEFPGLAGRVFMAPASLIGAPGLTLLTVLLAGAPVLGRRGCAGCAAGLALWAAYGANRLAPAAAPANLAVVLVQGAIPEGQKLDRARAIGIFEHYLALTRAGVAEARASASGLPIVVVWPETASPFLLDQDSGARDAIAGAAGPGATTLAGSVRFGADGRPRNSLVAIAANGAVLAIYDKWHLVPFGEYQPPWANVGIQLIPGGGFEPGPGPRTLDLPGLPPLGPLICYEAIFPAHVVDRADRPDWMVNVTNDAWFGNSSGPRQHLAAARMRAVEEGMPLVRAANTGISAAYDAHGRLLARIGLQVSGVAVVPLAVARPRLTLFGRFGLLVPLAGAMLALLGASVLMFMGYSRDNNEVCLRSRDESQNTRNPVDNLWLRR